MSKPKIYLVAGCPGSGKSWVCNQLQHKFTYVHHDGYIYLKAEEGAYVKAILKAAETSTRPLLIEAPFSVSNTVTPLRSAGYEVTPLYIVEHNGVVAERYMNREKKPIPKGHLTRMETYKRRALDEKAFFGTSAEVLNQLKHV